MALNYRRAKIYRIYLKSYQRQFVSLTAWQKIFTAPSNRMSASTFLLDYERQGNFFGIKKRAANGELVIVHGEEARWEALAPVFEFSL